MDMVVMSEVQFVVNDEMVEVGDDDEVELEQDELLATKTMVKMVGMVVVVITHDDDEVVDIVVLEKHHRVIVVDEDEVADIIVKLADNECDMGLEVPDEVGHIVFQVFVVDDIDEAEYSLVGIELLMVVDDDDEVRQEVVQQPIRVLDEIDANEYL